MNNRLHDKLLVVDNDYAIIGGRNVGICTMNAAGKMSAILMTGMC
ncbi:hypothetical protein [Alkalibacterium sp. s-m-28]